MWVLQWLLALVLLLLLLRWCCGLFAIDFTVAHVDFTVVCRVQFIPSGASNSGSYLFHCGLIYWFTIACRVDFTVV